MRVLVFALALIAASAAQALTLDLPGNPRLLVEEVAPHESITLPIGRFAEGGVPMRLAEGEVTRQVWRVAGEGLSSLAITAALRRQLQAQGFAILLDCAAPICGGFDFRRAVEVMPPPAMHVNLADFRYLSAETTPRGGMPERVGVLVSTTAQAASVQIIRVGDSRDAPLAEVSPLPLGGAAPDQTPDTASPDINAETFALILERDGRVTLGDLAFETGAAQLASGSYASLQWLADYLAAHPTRRIALVGHTDTEGSLEVNIALSKRRASSVVERLSREYGVLRQQITAEGMGYLAPLAGNLTPEGRSANRRVEAVLLSTE